VLLKRGLSATLEEFILAAEYILSQGNPQVILCERGIRSFDSYTRNVLDLGAVVALKQLTHLPVIVDPSHAAGKAELVADLARAAIACGADGLIIECHPEPDKSVSDARQALSLPDMVALVDSLRPIAAAVGRRVPEKNQPQLSIVEAAHQGALEKNDQSIATGVDLKNVRANIDELDKTMSQLLSKRFSLARQLKTIKAQLQLPVCDANRELAVLNNVAAAGTDSPMAEAIRNVWKTVIAQSRFLQAPEPQRAVQSTTISPTTSILSKYRLPWRSAK
jgi:chorismate mutase